MSSVFKNVLGTGVDLWEDKERTGSIIAHEGCAFQALPPQLYRFRSNEVFWVLPRGKGFQVKF